MVIKKESDKSNAKKLIDELVLNRFVRMRLENETMIELTEIPRTIEPETPVSCFYVKRLVSSPLYGFHCTTPAKMRRYQTSGRIIAPVRFWPNLDTAKRWAKRTGRSVILKIRLEDISYPLPDHKPALWCPADVLEFEDASAEFRRAANEL